MFTLLWDFFFTIRDTLKEVITNGFKSPLVDNPLKNFIFCEGLEEISNTLV